MTKYDDLIEGADFGGILSDEDAQQLKDQAQAHLDARNDPETVVLKALKGQHAATLSVAAIAYELGFAAAFQPVHAPNPFSEALEDLR